LQILPVPGGLVVLLDGLGLRDSLPGIAPIGPVREIEDIRADTNARLRVVDGTRARPDASDGTVERVMDRRRIEVGLVTILLWWR